jgi:hypothetical protein
MILRLTHWTDTEPMFVAPSPRQNARPALNNGKLPRTQVPLKIGSFTPQAQYLVNLYTLWMMTLSYVCNFEGSGGRCIELELVVANDALMLDKRYTDGCSKDTDTYLRIQMEVLGG